MLFRSKEAAETTPDNRPRGQHSFGDEGQRTLASSMKALLPYPLGFDPGTQWDYHVSTNMLGYLIEIISGMPLRDYVKKEVLEPLEMNDTDWYYAPDKLANFVRPYDYIDGKLNPSNAFFAQRAIGDDHTYCEAAIGLNGPIGDYAKFCQMLLNKGEFRGKRILMPQTVAILL